MASYSFVDVADLEGEGPGGAVRKVRRALGAHAFGFNYFTLPPGVRGREHDHAEERHEEVMFVVRGSGTLTVEPFDGDGVVSVPVRWKATWPSAVHHCLPPWKAGCWRPELPVTLRVPAARRRAVGG